MRAIWTPFQKQDRQGANARNAYHQSSCVQLVAVCRRCATCPEDQNPAQICRQFRYARRRVLPAATATVSFLLSALQHDALDPAERRPSATKPGMQCDVPPSRLEAGSRCCSTWNQSDNSILYRVVSSDVTHHMQTLNNAADMRP